MIMIRKHKHPILNILLVLALFSVCALFVPESDDCYFAYWQFTSLKDFLLTQPDTSQALIVSVPQNGRYLGNVLGVVLAKLFGSPLFFLRPLFFAGCLSALAWGSTLSLGPGIRKLESFGFMLSLLLLAPRGIWQEVYSWGAAYANYVTPMAGLIFLPWLLRRQASRRTHTGVAALFLLSFGCCLFMEPTTIFLALSALTTLCVSLFFRRTALLPCLSMTAGSLLGAAVMFTAPGYGAVGSDGLREMGLAMIGGNISAIFVGTLYRPVVPALLISALLLWHLRRQNSRGFFPCLAISVCLHAVCLWDAVRDLFDPGELVQLPPPAGYQVLVSFSLALLWLVMLVLWTGGKAKLRVIALAAALCLFSGPLLVISVTGYRNFFSGFVVLCLVALVLYDSARERGMRLLYWPRAVALLWACALVFVYACNCCVFHQRLDLAREQVELGAVQVVMPILPFPGFARNEQQWKGDVSYLIYRDAPWDVAFVFIPYSQWTANGGVHADYYYQEASLYEP